MHYCGTDEQWDLIEIGSNNDELLDATRDQHVYSNNRDADCNICGYIREVEQVIRGDVNNDGSVDAADLALLKKVIAKLTPIDSADVKNPNVDGQGTEPDAADLALLKKIIANLVTF